VGALDLSGNVWEWVLTIYDQDDYPYPYDAEDGRNDTAQTDVLRGLRGGSFDVTSFFLRAANRSGSGDGNAGDSFGFCSRAYEQ